MNKEDQKKLKTRLLNLSNILRAEQKTLLIEASNFEVLPNKNLLRQIAEIELNITAIDNTIAEFED